MPGDPNDTSRGVKLLSAFWPIGLAVATVFVSGVRTDAKVNEVERKTEYIFLNGSPPIVERLGRIEERQLTLVKAIDRIENRLGTAPVAGAEDGK